MTAAAHATAAHGAGLAAQRATRDARIRALLFALIGLAAVYFASQSFDTNATFSFWIDEQGGDSARFETTVGILWVNRG